MLIIQIAGGLGNQMQQYALYRKLLKYHPDGVRLDLSWFDSEVQKNMLAKREFELALFKGLPYIECKPEERAAFLDRNAAQKLSGKVLKKLGLRDNANPNVFEESRMFHPEIFELDNKYIIGYFACQKYYDDIMGDLCNLFEFPEHLDPELEKKNLELISKMEKENSVSVHIRRGDYLDPENFKILGNIATDEYYESAMKYFEDRYEKVHFYIFTSDHEYAREHFADESKYTIVDWNTGKDSLQDVRLMNHCLGNICANSTFSFWGARLNQRQDKVMIRTYKMRNNQPVDPDTMHDYWKGWILIDETGREV
ncbi:alpha-1,2-fucosyltransferase [Butyrivibrio sp. AE3009]|uniref:alpha-1,2-fucosyltransferase n=1 Tax=Butyrivibrio sp. AE3009 TaxID=1280666 RepID=UPI0003B3AAC0|nr:alpha-1,2-fucosyltransferase [Butyrivibrio sp. AE3009]